MTNLQKAEIALSLGGRGLGEGDYGIITATYLRPALNPLPRGEGNLIFYESINHGG